MMSNVWEWCWDWYGPYQADVTVDPVGPDGGDGRVLRGGSFYLWIGLQPFPNRYGRESDFWVKYVGFRCVRSARRQP